MTLNDDPKWVYVAGTAAGRAHLRSGRGSQDAVCVRRCRGGLVAVVCDGCSAGAGTAVGAGVGARFAAATIARLVGDGVAPDAIPHHLLTALIVELHRLATAWTTDVDLEGVIADSLLFTVQVAVVTDAWAVVFGVGDGRIRVDGADVDVPVNDDGAPDCPAYALLPALATHARLRIHAVIADADRLQTVTIATDGAWELGEALPIEAFEADDVMLTNPSLATKRLVANGGTNDDCTIVVIRRRLREQGGVACA